MSSVVPSRESVAGANVSTWRRAFYLTSAGLPLFAWLHLPAPSRRQDHGVLICAPAGHEQVHAHRTLRHLAERLADAGLNVVRFDFLGTGDSADLDDGADVHAAWRANIRDMLAWMRDHLGCQRISLMGLRLGATLAAEVATEQAIDSLVLWEPVVRGRAYARELKALSMIGEKAPQAGANPSDDIEAAGFVFGKRFLDEIGRIDLLKLTPKCGRALILGRADMPADGKLGQHLTAAGTATEQAALPGYADMLAEPHLNVVPHEAIAATMRWIVGTPSPPAPLPQGERGEMLQTSVRMGNTTIRERPLQITPDLFGILSEPDAATGLPFIVMPNAGSAYRIGSGRLYVMLARRLAACGFPCLRMDIAGIGDSVGPEGSRENDPYPATAFRDINLAIRHAQENFGVQRAIVMGLCSGAYVAFQSTAQHIHPAIVEGVLINPLTFFWKEGMTIDNDPMRHLSTFQYYKTSALHPQKWLKLLRGETKIGILGAGKMLLQRLGLRRQIADQGGASPDGPDRKLGHPAVNDVSGDLERIRQSGRQLACFFSRADPGYPLLTFLAGRKTKQLCKAGAMSLHFIEDADHTFSRRAPRQAFLDVVTAYLCQRYPR